MLMEESHIFELLEELEIMVQDAPSVRFSHSRCTVERDDILAIIADIKRVLPKEMRQAADVAEEKNDIINRAINEGKNIIEEAEEKAKSIIEYAQEDADNLKAETEEAVSEYVNSSRPMEEARAKSTAMIENAKSVAEEIKKGSVEYADELLSEVEEHVASVLHEIRKNREELR